MYCAPSDIIATTCGQHVLPILPNKESILPNKDSLTYSLTSGKGQCIQGAAKLLLDWQALQYAAVPVSVPAYIAYGLLEQSSLLDKAGSKSKGSQLAPQDLELHQQMLQKLALHLAAQPHAQPQLETLQNEEVPEAQSAHVDGQAAHKEHECHELHPVHSTGAPLEQEKAPRVANGPRGAEGKALQEAKGKGLSHQEQEFQHEMLRKLALHLAAQEEASLESVSVSKEVAEGAEVNVIVTPDVFPATPSSFGEENCEHYFIGDDLNDQGDEDTVHCSQCVMVPMHIAYGLIEGNSVFKTEAHPKELDFHQQMLQKLALHLAAQPDPLQASSVVEKTNDVAPKSTSKVAWADMVDDDLEMLQPTAAPVEKARTSCKNGTKAKSLSCNPKQNNPQEFQQEMLRKLALHLAAQPELEERPEEVALASVSKAKAVGDDKAHCDELIAELELQEDSTQTARATEIVDMVLPGSRTLSLTPSGSRLVQKVIGAASVKQREQLLQGLLEEDVTDLYSSPHANHVVAKLIEIMPARNLASIGEAMRGKATTVARHQFGSRILERLIEHCGEALIGFLLDELMEDFEALARHQFGNFVVARLLEHGTAARKQSCVQKLLPYVLQHATHKTACNIVERMLDNADLSCQAMIADAFLAGAGEFSLEAIAATRYGSFVIQHLVNRFHPRIDAVKARVKAAHSQLQASGFSQRKIVQFLGDAFFRE